MNKKAQSILGLSNLFVGVIVVTIGIWIFPILVDQIDIAAGASANTTNFEVSELVSTILGLFPLFFALGILLVGINMIMPLFRQFGMGSDRDEDEEDGEDHEEEEDENQEDDEEEEEEKCEQCKNKIYSEKQVYYCDKCEKEICIVCKIDYKNLDLCKECYQIVKLKEKQVKQESKKEEIKPIITKEKTSFEKKNKFEEKSKYD